jgi:hypothetical protein
MCRRLGGEGVREGRLGEGEESTGCAGERYNRMQNVAGRGRGRKLMFSVLGIFVEL